MKERAKVLLSYSILAWLALSGCRQPTEEKFPAVNKFAKNQYALKTTGRLSIPLDSVTASDLSSFQYWEEGSNRYYVVWNHIAGYIDIYDLDKRQLEYRVLLATEGDHAVPELNGFYWHNSDSIFLFSETGNEIILINAAGEIKKRYGVTDVLPGAYADYETLIDFDGFFRPSFENNILSFWAVPLISIGKKAFYRYPLAIDYDIYQEKIIRHFGYYPASYRGNDIFALRIDLNRILTPQYDIHTFEASHYLYLYDRKTKEFIRAVYAKSEFLPSHFTPLLHSGEPFPDLQQQFNYNVTEGRYHRLLYDADNKLYYRFVRHSQPLRDASGKINGKLDNRISVLMLNEDFEVAGETVLQEKRYLDYISFVSRGKLYVHTGHRKNPDFNEDYLQFDVFEPIQIQ